MRAQPPDLGVAVSNGFHKMHLATAAREANDRGFLKLLVTGAYPTPAFRRLLRWVPLAGSGPLGRIEQRDEGIPLERLRVLFLPELLERLARALARVPSSAASPRGSLSRPSASTGEWRLARSPERRGRGSLPRGLRRELHRHGT